MTSVTIQNPISDGLPPTPPSHLQRATQTLLPFLSLYKPLSQPLALASGSIQAFLSAGQLIESLRKGETNAVPMQLANTCISTLAVAGTLFAHPVGMLLTTGRDTVLEVLALARHVQNGENKEALESCASLVNNTLFVAMILGGGSPAALAYFGAQAMTGLYHSVDEFKKGNYIEGTGHAVMSMLRAHQFGSQAQTMIQERAAATIVQNDAAVATTSYATAAAKAVSQKPGQNDSFEKLADKAQYKGSDYANAIRVERGISLDKAFEIAKNDPEIDYFVYVKGWSMVLEIPPGVKYDPSKDPLKLVKHSPYIFQTPFGSYIEYFQYDSGQPGIGYYRAFSQGDTVFFKKEGMWLGTAPGLADTYVKTK